MKKSEYKEKKVVQREQEFLKKDFLQIIHDFSFAVLEQESIDDVFWCITQNAIAKLGFYDCIVYLLDSSGEFMIQAAAHGPKNPMTYVIKNPIKIPVGNGIVGTVAKTGLAEIVNDTSKDKRYILDDDFRFSEITVPIIANGVVRGIIDSEHPRKHFFKKEHLLILSVISNISANKILEAEAKKDLLEHKIILEQEVENRTQELNETLQKLTRSNNDLKQFAYAASHDLKQPLRMISSYIQLIEKNYGNLFDEEGRIFLDFVSNGAKELYHLIEALLQFSRAENNELNLEIFPLDDILFKAKFHLKELIDDTNTTIVAETLPELEVSVVLMVQLFQNIIENAITYSKVDTPPLIHVNYLPTEEYHIIAFQDNGIGIDEKYYAAIFQLFRKIPISIKTKQSSGIGLATCKSIVDKHNGKIWVESKTNLGSTFFVQLPKKR